MLKSFFFRIVVLLLLVALVGGGALGCASTPSSTPSSPPSSTPSGSAPPPAPPSPPSPPPKPDIKAVATIPQGNSVPFGGTFTMIVMVNNYGNAPAQNLHLYARANPSGYFKILNCDRPYSPLAPAGMDISLGDLYPGYGAQVRIDLRAPTQAQIGGQQGLNVEVSFTYDYYGGSGYAGKMVFSVGGGVMMFRWE